MSEAQQTDRLKELVAKANFFTSDSRLTDEDTIFVALVGEQVDGHDFVHDALARGAVACLVERDVELQDPRILSCKSTAQAHRLLARLFREKFKGKIIAVGGSNGKTSTKDFLYSLLSQRYSAIKTMHSQNGFQGIPATLERLRPGLDYAVIEVGIDGPGDMDQHLEIVQPDFAILTSIGAEHLRQLKDLEGVFAEESKLIFDCLKRGGICFIPEGDPYLARLKNEARVITCPQDPMQIDSRFVAEGLFGVARTNASLAISCALKLGMTHDQVLEALPHFRIPSGRGNITRISDQEYVLEDYYNANLSSMTASIRLAVQKSQELKLPLYVVIGDMLDLGEQSSQVHKQILKILEPVSYAQVFLVGPEFGRAQSEANLPRTQVFSDSTSLANTMGTLIRKPYFAMFKGSRGMKLERALERLRDQ